jgi:hypothetical protein
MDGIGVCLPACLPACLSACLPFARALSHSHILPIKSNLPPNTFIPPPTPHPHIHTQLRTWTLSNTQEISPAIVYKYTTIREVAGFLARGADEAELSNPDADDAIEPDPEGPIAIVGVGLKAPGGSGNGNLVGKEAFWRFVLAGGDAIREDMPPERKSESGDGALPGGYIDGPDAFDAAFFGMSPAEAAHMDYHQGLVLETAWHALEDAGIEPGSLGGRTVGVYIGAISHEFAVLESLRGEASTWAATGVSNSLVANRLSYQLNVRGPSVTIDTACSSSLVAVHDAVRDLREGSCAMALAGGVNLILSSSASSALKKAGFLSTACRTFDAQGDGYCRGEVRCVCGCVYAWSGFGGG